VLRAAWQAAARREPRFVVVGGEAGVGKTRLIDELARAVRESDGRVLIGGSADFGTGGLPLGPIIEALRPLTAMVPRGQLSHLLGAAMPELARLLPELADDEARLAPGPSDEFARARIFELLLSFLDRLSQDRPTLLVLEDLHWADASTRDFLAFLARNLREERLLVVGTYRSDELDRRHPLRGYLAELERSGRIEPLALAPFELLELRLQMEAILGREPGPELTERVFRRSEGNPFFTEELLAAAGSHGREALPATLQAILAARLDALSEPAQQIARIAAVAGRPIDEGLLAAVAATAEEQLVDALREAVSQQLLVPQPAAAGQKYVVRHALLQEAIYADLLPGERTRLHRSVAGALASRRASATPGEREVAPQLAHHWYQAHEFPRALEASVEAGLAAYRSFGFREALAHLERALELWPAVEDPTVIAGMDRVSLLWHAAHAARGARHSARAGALLRAAIAEADAAREPLRVGGLHGDLMLCLLETGDSVGAEAAITAGLRLTSVQPRTSERASVLMLAGVRLALSARHREALPLLLEAREVAIAADATDQEVPSPSGLSMTLGTLVPTALCTAYLGDVDEAVRLLLDERQLARQRHRVSALADTYHVQAIVLEAAGRFDEAVAVVEEALDEMRSLMLERTLGAGFQTAAAESLRHLGRWAEAERIGREVTRDVAGVGGGWSAAVPHAARGLLLVGMGRLEEAETEWSAAQDAFPLSAGGQAIGFSGLYFGGRAEAALSRSMPELALDYVAEGLRNIEGSGDIRWIGHLSALGLRADADLAEVARLQRDQAREQTALAAGEDLVARFRASARTRLEDGTIFRREARGYLALTEAEFARLAGRSDPTLWAASARTWEGLQEPYPVAYALFRQADASLRTSQSRAEPARLLDKARGIARTLGAEPLRKEIEALAKRARLNLTSDEKTVTSGADETPNALLDAYRLTAREREVLAMLGSGRSDREIADALYISGKTASVHVSNIKGKLGVNHRAEAATVAIRLGLTGEADKDR
jgi:DNA-binding CsgD family transcriptional regulator